MYVWAGGGGVWGEGTDKRKCMVQISLLIFKLLSACHKVQLQYLFKQTKKVKKNNLYIRTSLVIRCSSCWYIVLMKVYLDQNVTLKTTSSEVVRLCSFLRIYTYTILYNILMWLLCAFSLVVNVDRDLLKDTQMTSNPRHITSADFFFFFHPSINHLNFYCIKQIGNIFPCVCTVIEQRRRHNV